MKHRVLCFTSINFAYLPKARVLAESLKRHHPDWHFVLAMTDLPMAETGFSVDEEDFDEILWTTEYLNELGPSWFFSHDVVEVCTAVKGPLLRDFCDRDFDHIVYLDPDTVVFSSLNTLLDELHRNDILLTPHQLTPECNEIAIIDNEICALNHGVYNLGFVAINAKDNGVLFADWWAARLRKYCVDEKERGIFVDQKWCDLVPALFEKVKVLRDPGFNVASWNLSNRVIDIDSSGDIKVNGSKLKFFHFTKLGPTGDVMTQRYAAGNFQVYELWSWYKASVARMTPKEIDLGSWALGRFSDGSRITNAHRALYRDREDLKAAFPDPYHASDEARGFLGWYEHEIERCQG